MNRRTNEKIKKALPVVLSVTSVIGVGVTAVVSAKCAIKATRKLDKAEEEKGEPLTKKEKFKLAAPVYIPAVISGVLTSGAVTGAAIINEKQKASLAMTAALMTSRYNELKAKLKRLSPEEQAKLMEKTLNEGLETGAIQRDAGQKTSPEQELWHEDHFGYFFATKDEVYNAFLEMQRVLSTHGYVTLDVFADNIAELSGLFVNEAFRGKIGDTVKKIGWSDEWLYESSDAVYIPVHVEKYPLEPSAGEYANVCHDIQWIIDPIYEPWEYYKDGDGVKPEPIHA